ncbi:MAG TPA: hypothetical protein VLF89_02680 [Candidatus Saccharimonadales bacterium]|nr:hypothetical protein [Candidatus Saccharimonadales bacterium]
MTVEQDPSSRKERNPLLIPYFNLSSGHTQGIKDNAGELFRALERKKLIREPAKDIFELHASIAEFNEVMTGATPEERNVVVHILKNELEQDDGLRFDYYEMLVGKYLPSDDESQKNIEKIRLFHSDLWKYVNNVRAISLCGQFSPEELDIIGENITAEAFAENVASLERADDSIRNLIPVPLDPIAPQG